MTAESTIMANAALEILQGKRTGDEYAAANHLAAYIERHYEVDAHNEGLTDWLASGDYDGNETINSLIAEWTENN